jgi:hypothetical protein
MFLRTLALMLVLLSSNAWAATNPCGLGTKVADGCGGVAAAGCCVDATTAQWCAGGVLCELSCAKNPACGWNAATSSYTCGKKPAADPACANPYSCFQGGCAPSYESAGCCDCPCEEAVCKQDPYCCTTKWDGHCVDLCKGAGGCGSSDGCLPSQTGGCRDCDCQACVCNIDPYCCTDKWDLLCAQYCVTQCDGGCTPCQADCDGKQCGTDGCGGVCGVCPSGYNCESGQCVKTCVPSCKGRQCGSNGCGGSCGTCGTTKDCNLYGLCVDKPCVPQCSGKQCGSDGCGGSCGICLEDSKCDNGVCVKLDCVPDCKGKQCGQDGCGGFCGFCDAGNICEADNRCHPYCPPDCNNRQCGSDGCGGTCGSCEPGLECFSGQCKAPCYPLCDNRNCGTDFCGGSCGTCTAAAPYCTDGQCRANCIASCAGRQCGDDGCGGSCGTCAEGWFCNSLGACSPFCQPNCFVPPDFAAEKQCGWNGCPGQGFCGQPCGDGFRCNKQYQCEEIRCACDKIGMCGSPADGCPSCGSCPDGFQCDLETEKDPEVNVCKPCPPNCLRDDGTFKECGNDGCGGTCGLCPVGWACDTDANDGDELLFRCEICTPSCLQSDGFTPKECGDDGCGGQCGFCSIPGDICDEDKGICKQCESVCLLPPMNIETMACGPNSCPPGCMDIGAVPCSKQSDCPFGTECNAWSKVCVSCGSCGSCPLGYMCDVSLEDDPEVYVCEKCTPACAGKECGDDGCGGVCGVCTTGFNCTSEFKCEKKCSPMCLNKECGPNTCPDGCMDEGTVACDADGKCSSGICDPKQGLCVPCTGSCGKCDDDEICSADYICVPKATDPCLNRECGSDGKGGSCGTCEDDEVCEDGTCVTAPVDVVGQDTKDTAPAPDVDMTGPTEEVSQLCPAGYHWYYNRCIKDTEPEPEDNKPSSSCTVSNSAPATAGLLLLLALALAAHRFARRRS